MGSIPTACQPCWSEKGGGSLGWAFRALRRELFGFRFDYPIEAVQGAGSVDSLHYYVHSDYLFLDDLKFDQAGIPMKCYRAQGAQCIPHFIVWWGIVNLERYLKTPDGECWKLSLRLAQERVF